jgi:hypothetical protein
VLRAKWHPGGTHMARKVAAQKHNPALKWDAPKAARPLASRYAAKEREEWKRQNTSNQFEVALTER